MPKTMISYEYLIRKDDYIIFIISSAAFYVIPVFAFFFMVISDYILTRVSSNQYNLDS